MPIAHDRISSVGGNGRASTAPENPTSPLHDLSTQISALMSYAAHFATAKLDAAKIRARRVVIGIVLGMVGLLLLTTMIVLCAVYLASGVAGGLAAGLDLQPWFAQLLTGVLGLGVLAGAIGFTLRFSRAKRQKERVNKYELRKRRQRAKFNRDAGAPNQENA